MKGAGEGSSEPLVAEQRDGCLSLEDAVVTAVRWSAIVGQRHVGVSMLKMQSAMQPGPVSLSVAQQPMARGAVQF